jgi:hypothetical protein
MKSTESLMINSNDCPLTAKKYPKLRSSVTAPAAFRDIVFRSARFRFLGRRTEEYGLSDRQSTDASDRAVDSRVVLVRTNDRLHHFWRRTG